MNPFNEFGLDERIVEAVMDLGFEKPTSIQLSAIPVLLEGHDVIGRARTGSGKTAAFGLPLIEQVKAGSKKVKALVIAPTRELAIQVSEAVGQFATKVPVRIATIYGGSPYAPQLKALKKGSSVVVGTPGRIIDHIKRGSLDLSNVEMLVLDEADEMLRMGFIEAVEEILAALPEERQIALFSATMPPVIERIARRFLVKPVILPVEDDGVEHIEQCYLRVTPRKKFAALVRILMGRARGTTLVFARTRVGCAEVADSLVKNGIAADAIHGDLNQPARERVISRLKSKALRVLVATDVAARGIDISHITHVINLDLPGDTDTYVHRIGRTGRAGAKGAAITFVTPSERKRLKHMQNKLKISMKEIYAPDNAELDVLRRVTIWNDLTAHMDGQEEMQSWLSALTEEHEVSVEQVAAAALGYLCGQRELPMEEAKPERDARPSRNLSDDDRQSLNEVEIFLSIGRRAGIQIGDVVGAITNGAGISGGQIGRISLSDSKCFVGLPRDVATMLLKEHPELVVRGRQAKLAMAREDGTSRSRGRGPKPNRARGRKGGGMKNRRERGGGKRSGRRSNR
jgi:ATP-dependent RNA helicase DeaD